MLGGKLETYKRRFDFLLLEENEYYLEDFGAYAFLPVSSKSASAAAVSSLASRKAVKGRIHVCSRNVVFDPDEARYPVFRLPLKEIAAIRPYKGAAAASQYGGPEQFFAIHCTKIVEMRTFNQATPYKFRTVPLESAESEFIFSLQYVTLAKFSESISPVHLIERGTAVDPREKKALLDSLLRSIEEQTPFDRSRFADLRETPKLPNGDPVTVSQITPLVSTPGHLMLTDGGLYFQPFRNITTRPVHHYDLASIDSVFRRRYTMRDVGLEIYFRPPSVRRVNTVTTESVYFAFKDSDTRDMVLRLLLAQPKVSITEESTLSRMTQRWRKGELSNYDYLVFLNEKAGRSFNDLTQYPVFPWVIADYTSEELDLENPATFRDLSKPVGALNPERLEHFKQRFRDMPPEMCDNKPFLYGTHYSTPGYVLYYLVRVAPEYMLRLQNGRFDAPDRMFFDVAHTWSSCLKNPSDVKELIPEFYDTTHGGAFLENTRHLPLGNRASGEPVDDVKLPPWVKSGAAAEFVERCREALESQYVSEHLHEWIDLIFGYKQRGQAAIDADNVFYHLTYEGAVDVDAIDDPQERAVLEAQIREFGQTPKQIFTRPHPKRFTEEDEAEVAEAILGAAPLAVDADPVADEDPTRSSRVSMTSEDSRVNMDALATPTSLHGVTGSFSHLDELASRSEEARRGSLVAAMSPTTRRLSADLGKLEVEPVLDLDDGQARALQDPSDDAAAPSSAQASAGGSKRKSAWHFDTIELDQTLTIHHEEVTAVALSEDASTVFAAYQDSTFKVYSVELKRQRRSTHICDLAISACTLTDDGVSAILGSWDNHLYLYSVSYGRVLGSVMAHDDAVSCLRLRGDKLISGSWDASVKLWHLENARGLPDMPLAELVDHATEVRAVDMNADCTVGVSGDDSGCIIVWDLITESAVSSIVACSDAVVRLHLSDDGKEVTAAHAGGLVATYQVSTGKAISSLDTGLHITAFSTDGYYGVIGDESGALHLWDLSVNERLHSSGSRSGPISCIASSKDGATVLTGHNGAKDNLSLWKLSL